MNQMMKFIVRMKFPVYGCKPRYMYFLYDLLSADFTNVKVFQAQKKISTCSLFNCQSKDNRSQLLNLPENQNKLEALKIELEVYRHYQNEFIPENVTDKHWEEILKLPTKSSRLKYYKFLRITELKNSRFKEEKMTLKTERWEKKQANKSHIIYGLNENCTMFQVRRSTINDFYENNLRHAFLFGQDIVFDMDFEGKMSSKETLDCVKQIRRGILVNMRNPEPFHLHFCNVFPNSILMEKLKHSVGPLQHKKPLIITSQESYLELFPKEKVVYLSPHCRTDLKYDHDDIYIIGGLVDKSQQGELSLAKAKREGLRLARLPIDRYLEWRRGTKCLALYQVLSILLTVRDTSSWLEAFKHIPEHKFKPYLQNG